MKTVNIALAITLFTLSTGLIAQNDTPYIVPPGMSEEQFDTSAAEKYNNREFTLCMQVATALYFQHGKTSIEEIEAEFKTKNFDFSLCKEEFSEQMAYMQPQGTGAGNFLIGETQKPEQQHPPQFTPEDAVRMMQEKFN